VGGTVKRRIAARLALLVVAIAPSLLAGSCNNNLTWWLQTWAGLDMLEVRGGTTALGDLEGHDMNGDQVPVHTVPISTFELSRYEVTQSLYEFIMGTNPSYFQAPLYSDDPCRPVEQVSWQDAIEFCNELSLYAGLEPCYTIDAGETTVTWDTAANGYRLPPEAEWEHASRGGMVSEGYEFSGSDTPTEVGWSDANSTFEGSFYRTEPVGSLGSNELGFYDMSGNVVEWCWDVYIFDGYLGLDGTTDPRGPADTEAPINQGQTFVARGGASGLPVDYTRNAHRLYGSDFDTGKEGGFRVARNR